jgi:hypothetical protein
MRLYLGWDDPEDDSKTIQNLKVTDEAQILQNVNGYCSTN